jgi:general secretion pathway protein M
MNASIDRFRAWWDAQSERDRRILAVGAVFVAGFLAYAAVFEPLRRTRVAREQALSEARSLAVRLESIAAEVKRGAATGSLVPGQSLLAAVDQASKATTFGKDAHLQPEGDNVVKVAIDNVPFEAVVRWIHDLQARYGVRVDAAEFDRQPDPGRVNAHLTVVKG